MTTPMTLSADRRRYLVVTADDFGIGPETTRGILDLAARGIVTSTVLLSNSPHAAEGVAHWRQAGATLELGWHPCLTIDAPVLPAEQVPTLVDANGRFPRLGTLLKRLIRGRVNRIEIQSEFQAQYDRFVALTGFAPLAVNAHHHVHVFRPVGDALAAVLAQQHPRPFLRRVCEPARTFLRVPGARIKRLVLDRIGRGAAERQHVANLPGNDRLIGITDPPFVHRPDFFARWLRSTPGQFVELSCHPGHLDLTLDGRDGTIGDGHIHRRPRELELLGDPSFQDAVNACGFQLVTAAELVQLRHPLIRPRLAA